MFVALLVNIYFQVLLVLWYSSSSWSKLKVFSFQQLLAFSYLPLSTCTYSIVVRVYVLALDMYLIYKVPVISILVEMNVMINPKHQLSTLNPNIKPNPQPIKPRMMDIITGQQMEHHTVTFGETSVTPSMASHEDWLLRLICRAFLLLIYRTGQTANFQWFFV